MKEKKLLSKTTILVAILLAATLPLWANHVVVGTVSLIDQNTTSNYTHIEFDISWENSWRTSSGPSNWDAAWIFAKWKLHTGSTWSHCTLSSTDVDHTAPSGSTIDAASDGIGIFIYRNANGTGNVSWDDVKLQWNYGTDGVADDATVDVKVFAIEMVYVPQDSFYVGDGSSTYRFHDGDNNNQSFQVTSSQIEFGTSDGKLWATGEWDSPSGSLQTDFPTGYDAFYCMKYEISQQQYVDFLNTLTSTQASNRYPDQNGNLRHAITVSGGTYSTTNPYVACNYLNWADGTAYADWAGLRPMTELEFEKACRGDQSAVANEYAWGTADIASSAYTLSSSGNSDEGIATSYSTTEGNANYNTTKGEINGPLRVGIFAANSSNSGRETAGASYYGIMELSGNLLERPVTVGNLTGRNFTGGHGDGALTSGGDANVTNWPGTDAVGAGLRGGGWNFAAVYLRTSYRNYATFTDSSRDYYHGFRASKTE